MKEPVLKSWAHLNQVGVLPLTSVGPGFLQASLGQNNIYEGKRQELGKGPNKQQRIREWVTRQTFPLYPSTSGLCTGFSAVLGQQNLKNQFEWQTSEQEIMYRLVYIGHVYVSCCIAIAMHCGNVVAAVTNHDATAMLPQKHTSLLQCIATAM